MLHLYRYMYLAMQVKNLKWIFIYTRDKITFNDVKLQVDEEV